jgi:hypothetical protein
MRPKCNLTEEERDRILPKINSWITDEEDEALRERMPKYMFYWYDNRKRQTYCSGCGARNRGTMGKLQHGKTVGCTVCGREMKAASTGRYGYAMKALAEWTKAAFIRTDEEGNILIMTADVLWYYNQDNLRGDLGIETKSKYYFAPGKVQMWARGEEWLGNGKWKYYPKPTKTVGEGFADGYLYGCMEANGTYYVIGLEQLERSNFRYCAVWEFFDRLGLDIEAHRARWVISYLAQYAMRPQIEMAVKIGIREAVAELVEQGRVNSRWLNWKATTAAGFLRMGKADANAFLRAGMDLEELRFWHNTCSEMSMTEYIGFRKRCGNEHEATLLKNTAKKAGCTVTQAMNYAEKAGNLRLWSDYLDMAERLNYDLTDRTVAMPKNLRERHDAAVETIEYRKKEGREKEYLKRREKLRKRYEFSLDGLRVMVPETVQDIVEEGKTLHHCVGGYAGRHVSGATCILFIRHERRPERSFLTLELDEKKLWIRQVHGYRNEGYKNAVPPRIRYQGFIETWLEWVRAGSKRNRKGQAILPERVKTA